MTFKEYHEKMKSLSEQESFVLFNEFKNEQKMQEQKGFEYLNESENLEVDRLANILKEEFAGDINNIDEGVLGKIFGGVAGFLVGPSIGKTVANALGLEKGVLYDLFCSKLVGIALGSAIGKHLGENKNKK